MASNICACGKPFVSCGSMISTLLGYSSPPGHNHDDNCQKIMYFCEDNHGTTISLRRSCPACDWRGKETCYCCKDGKVDKWPEVVSVRHE